MNAFVTHTNPQGQADALYLLARVHIRAGNLDQAKTTLLHATLAFPKGSITPSREAKSHWLLGLIYRRENKLAEAEAEYRVALDLAGVGGDSRLKAQIHHGLADCYLEAGDFPAAEQWFGMARKISEKISDMPGVLANDYGLAKVQWVQICKRRHSGRPGEPAGDQADSHLENAALLNRILHQCYDLEQQKQIQKTTKAKVMLLRGRVLFAMQSPKAGEAFSQAAELFAELGFVYEQTEALAELAEGYDASHEPAPPPPFHLPRICGGIRLPSQQRQKPCAGFWR